MNRPKKISLTYEISRRCNLNCAFCYNAWKMHGESSRVVSISSSDDASRQLNSRQALFLLAKAIDEMECSDISLSGGEPLLREDIFDVISFLKKRNVKVSLITNGALLTEDAIEMSLLWSRHFPGYTVE
jgi:MoaA/NifB/PqqE/SkfB family radical SAM enzyme